MTIDAHVYVQASCLYCHESFDVEAHDEPRADDVFDWIEKYLPDGWRLAANDVVCPLCSEENDDQ